MVGVLKKIRKGVRMLIVAVRIMRRRSIVPADGQEVVDIFLENFRHKLPKFEETNKGLIPAQAVLVCRSDITEYEKKEIKEYPAIYTVGKLEEKSLEHHLSECFTTLDGIYVAGKGDHISYRYEIKKALGEGSYSQVFQCVDKRCEKEVAIKMIKNNKQPLYNEILMLTKIIQLDPEWKTNCIRLLNYGHFRNHFYLVVECMPMDLETYLLKNHSRGVKFYASMLKSILHSLAFLKTHMIIHGDLKPSNILVDPRNPKVLKLADFGLSTVGPLKITDHVFQSRFYRAPEVFCRGVASPAMDMWSFACILAEALIGKPYLWGDTDFDQFTLIQQYLGPPPAFYFEEYYCVPTLFFPNRVPTHCKLLIHPVTGKAELIIHPKYSSFKPDRLPPGASDFNDDFPGKDLAYLRDFLLRCFVWNPKERIVPAFALNHPLFVKLDP